MLRGLLAGAKASLLPSHEKQWARVITSWETVPEAYRGHIEALVRDEATFPYMVLAPPYPAFKRREKDRLVFCLHGNVYVLETARGEITTICYPIEKIAHVEVGGALLHAWVRIWGTTGDDVLACSEIRFNAVTDYLFTPIVETLRPPPGPFEKMAPDVARREFDHLSRLNLKLMNYARRSIAPGDRVVQTIFQPEIRTEVLRLFGHAFLKTICTPHVTILTDRELILIQDGIGKSVGEDARHGGIWDYISLAKIASISVADAQGDLLTLSVHLPEDDRVDVVFSASKGRELDVLLSHFEASQDRG